MPAGCDRAGGMVIGMVIGPGMWRPMALVRSVSLSLWLTPQAWLKTLDQPSHFPGPVPFSFFFPFSFSDPDPSSKYRLFSSMYYNQRR